MKTLKTLSLSVCGAALVALTVVHAQNRPITLTALDYIQIQQVVFEAQFALLGGLDDGRLYAQQFTPNGTMNDISGTAALTAHAKGGRPGVRSLLTNVIIEPTAQGAIGRHYEFMVNFVKGRDEPAELGTTGRYEDTFARTPAGWRIQKRVFVPSVFTSEASKAVVNGPPPDPAVKRPPVPDAVPLTRPSKTPFAGLTAMDYIQIQNLVASYGQALDNGLMNDDNGPAYASLFAPGAVFGRPYTQGEEPLKALARTQPHNKRYARHFLTNIVIDPAPEGAVGRQYLVVIDQGENGKPSSVLIAGHYEDSYVKTPAGWKFKQRTLFPARTGPIPPA